MKHRVLCVFLTIVMAVSIGSCGKKKQELKADVSENIALAPLKEEAVSPAVESQTPSDDPNAVGNIIYYPNNNEFLGALAGANTLTIYFEKSGVSSGTGRVSVYNEDDYSLLSYVDVSDSSSCKMAPIDMYGTQLSGWSNGTKATLYFSKPFITGKRYFVLMDAGCFTVNGIESKAITNPSLMTITTKPYGVASDIRDKYNFGDTATLSLIVGGDCKRVLIQEFDDDAVLPSQTMLSSSGDVYLTFMKEGSVSFKISFYDETSEIDSITYLVNVASTAADVSHDGASSINDGTVSEQPVVATDSPETTHDHKRDRSENGVETLN